MYVPQIACDCYIDNSSLCMHAPRWLSAFSPKMPTTLGTMQSDRIKSSLPIFLTTRIHMIIPCLGTISAIPGWGHLTRHFIRAVTISIWFINNFRLFWHHAGLLHRGWTSRDRHSSSLFRCQGTLLSPQNADPNLALAPYSFNDSGFFQVRISDASPVAG
jgi:hypothetical protein